MGLVRTIDAAVEPVSVDEMLQHLRVTETEEHSLIADYIKSARDVVEHLSGRALVNQTWKYTADAFQTAPLELRPSPLVSITSVKYIDLDGTQQTAATSVYEADTTSVLGRLVLKYNQTWPTCRNQTNAIEVIYVAGYGSSSSDVPACARQAIRYLVAHQHENREAVLTGSISKELEFTVNAMIDPIRILEVM